MKPKNVFPIDRNNLAEVLDQLGISDISYSTIRQAGSIARCLESSIDTEFLHLEMGIPGLPPAKVGVEAEKAALDAGVASIYPNMMGTPELKKQASRSLKHVSRISLMLPKSRLLCCNVSRHLPSSTLAK